MRRWIAVIAVLALVAGACSKKTNNNAQSTSPTPTASATETPLPSSTVNIASPFNDHGTKDVSGATQSELELENFYFNPSVLKGTPGQKLTLMIKDTGSVPHNFTLEEQHFNEDLVVGQSKTVTVTFPASGTLQFHCEYHEKRGMKGALTV